MISHDHSTMAAYLILLLGLIVTGAGKGADLTPLETMADVTNDFGVCVLQIIASPSSNTVFSPYGLVSMALLVYEGSTGQTAAEIYNALHLPWHRDIVRIGFRDLHRYLRSYFSSEGFLKGLVLSKPNVSLKPSYVEVLRFYGFQPDNTITQPVLTTQASISNREKDSNETTMTTNEPETTAFPTGPGAMTTQPTSMKPTKGTSVKKPNKNMTTTGTTMKTPMTPVTTMKATSGKKPSKKDMNMTMFTTEAMLPFFTTEATVVDTTTYVITTMNASPNQPEVLNMQGMTTTKAEVTSSRPEETTIINETTKRDITTTQISGQNKTSIKITTSSSSVSTKKEEITTEQMETTTNTITATDNKTLNESTSSNEVVQSNNEEQTDSATTDMDVVTLTNKILPEPESMNMMLDMNNSTEDEQSSAEDTGSETSLENEMTTKQTESSTVPEFVPNEVTTQGGYPGETLIDTITLSTLYVDSTIPIDDFVILTTPADLEVMTQKDSSMLEAFILMEDSKEQIKLPEFNGIEGTNKRSTQNPVTKSPIIEYTIPLNNLYTSVEELGLNQVDDSVSHINQEENYSHPILSGSSINYDDTTNVNVQNSIESMIDQQNSTNSSTEESFSEEHSNGFPTLEPDTIIFPTKKVPRQRRAVRSEERSAPLGNWVGPAAGWRPSPTDQWFWTYSGDKLVPVLTYSAYIPWADLPTLGSTAIQLPLDDPRYSLMILLPKNARGLKQTLYSLQWYPIRDILKLFKPTPVYAVVPTFTIIKHINLTPALHKLGIRSMFEAYLANLQEMSMEPNLYVRTIEQLITISVQKYYTNHKWLEASPEQVNQHFLATHPFAYFVVDIETKVVLVAGTMVDPTLRSS